jgi:hypothetical protein
MPAVQRPDNESSTSQSFVTSAHAYVQSRATLEDVRFPRQRNDSRIPRDQQGRLCGLIGQPPRLCQVRSSFHQHPLSTYARGPEGRETYYTLDIPQIVIEQAEPSLDREETLECRKGGRARAFGLRHDEGLLGGQGERARGGERQKGRETVSGEETHGRWCRVGERQRRRERGRRAVSSGERGRRRRWR